MPGTAHPSPCPEQNACTQHRFPLCFVRAAVSDVQNGTVDAGQMQNVSTADVGASALSRIRAIQSAASGEDAVRQHLQILWNVCFWSAVVIGGFAGLHIALLLLLRYKQVSRGEAQALGGDAVGVLPAQQLAAMMHVELLVRRMPTPRPCPPSSPPLAPLQKPIPKMLHLPRLELLLFMMVLPMIVAAGATLLRAHGAGYVAAGVFFAVLLPVAFVGVSLAFIIRYLVRHSVDQRRAVFVLALPPTVATPGAAAAGQSPFQQQSQQQQEQLPELTPRGSSALSPTQQQQFLRPSTSGLTQQFLGPADSGLSHFASATSTAQFILQRQPSAALSAADAGGVPTLEAGTAPGSPASPGGSSGSASGGGIRGACRRGWQGFQRFFMRPVFGFDLSGGSQQQQQQSSAATIPVGTVADGGSLAGQGAWLCKSKWDTAFVKRYGSLFEDARGPQVYHITSVYETAATDGEPAGAGPSAVLQPFEPALHGMPGATALTPAC